MVARIEETLKKLLDKGVQSVEYFHCDHFEPWRSGSRMKCVDDLHNFLEMTRQSEFASSLTLFYKPELSKIHFGKVKPGDVSAIDNEEIGFRQRNAWQKEIANHPMQQVAQSDHEIQLHLHHEGFTLSDVSHDKPVHDWLMAHGSEKGDSARLNLSIQLTLQAIREDTGLPMDRWAFVHGNWALNGSDHRICRIKDEISILQRNGCFGDFTFPAGRRQVDPTLHLTPYTCIPQKCDRGYDVPDAKPLSLSSAGAREKGRFFIWNSVLKHPYASIDYTSKTVQKIFIDPDDVVIKWLEESPIFDGKLYIKTHAHSMFKYYWEHLEKPIIPHDWPGVQLAFGHLRDACEKAGIEFNLTTVNEVHDSLMTGDFPVETPCLLTGSLLMNQKKNKPTAAVQRKKDKSAEKKFRTEMNRLWALSGNPQNRIDALKIAKKLYDLYDSKSAAYRLGVASYLGKGIKKDHTSAYKFFSHKSLEDNMDIAFYRGDILLASKPSTEDEKLALRLLAKAKKAGVEGAADRIRDWKETRR